MRLVATYSVSSRYTTSAFSCSTLMISSMGWSRSRASRSLIVRGAVCTILSSRLPVNLLRHAMMRSSVFCVNLVFRDAMRDGERCVGLAGGQHAVGPVAHGGVRPVVFAVGERLPAFLRLGGPRGQQGVQWGQVDQ